MSMTVRELFVKLGVKADNAELQRFDKGVSQVKTGMMGLVKVAGIVGGALTGTFLFAKSIAQAGDEAEKTATNIGIASEELQKLQYAGQRSGLSTQELTVSLKTLNKSVYESARGMSTYKDAFDAMGISATDATGKQKTADVVLGEMADSFAKINDPARKAALAQTLMGRSGYKMVTMLKDGKVGLDELKNKLVEFNAVITDEARKDAVDFNDNMLDVKKAIFGVKLALGKDLLPVFIEFFKKLQKGIIEFRKTWVETGRLQRAIKILTKAAALFLGIWTLSSVGTMFMGITNAIMGLIGLYKTLGAAALLTQAKMMLMPVLVGAAILFFTGLMIELYNLFFTDKKTIFHYILEDMKTIIAYWKSELQDSQLGKWLGVGAKKEEKTELGISKKAHQTIQTIAGDSLDPLKPAREAIVEKFKDIWWNITVPYKTPDPSQVFGATTTTRTINVGGIVINESNDPQKTTKAIENAFGGLELQP